MNVEDNEKKQLEAYHLPEVIRERIIQGGKYSYLGDFILGGIDGCVTTFAIVAGVAGAGFSSVVAIILGVSNLLADGFSMAVSNYQATKSRQDVVTDARRNEERHVDIYPEGEKEEVRQIYKQKGLEGAALEEVVTAITKDRKLWVDTILREGFHLDINGPKPLHASLATFVSFLVVGFLPLSPYLLMPATNETFILSSVIAGVSFFGIGLMKGVIINRSLVKSGLETLLAGGAAAVIAYGVGYALDHYLQVQ